MIRAEPMTMRFIREGAKVVLLLNERRAADLGWKVARELGRAFQRPDATDLCPAPTPFEVRVQPMIEGGGRNDRVMLLCRGKLLADPPRDAAHKLGAMLIGEAGLAEEHEKAEQIIPDAALAIRSGAPFGLSDNPKINEEAKKEAFHNRDLRRYLPQMKGTAVLGTPRVRQFSPDPAQAARETLANMTPDQRLALARQALTT